MSGCGGGLRTATCLPSADIPLFLNADIDVTLDGAIDPLTVDDASVRVVSEDGTALPVALAVGDGRLKVALVVTPELLSGKSFDAWLEVAGLPSPLAIRTLDGRRLSGPVRRHLRLQPLLQSATAEHPQLLSIDGRAPGGEPMTVSSEITLTFSGVLDPATLLPANCPIFPIAGQLRLPTPILPEVRWRCIGERFDLILTIPPGSGRLRLLMRALAVRDIAGRAPEPDALVADLIAP
jgi:hypothetical protein